MKMKMVEEFMSTVDEDSEYIQSLVDDLVKSCCETLDEYVKWVSALLADSSIHVTNEQLDDIIMTIPTLLYFVGTQQERYGIKRDVSKASKSTLYNKIYRETVGIASVKKAAAEDATFNENLVTTVFSSAYDTIKTKMEYATELLQSAKKVVSRRMTESDLTRFTPNIEREKR